MIETYKNLIQKNLEKYFEEQKSKAKYCEDIWNSMSYTTLLKAKRLRAVLFFASSTENIVT